MTSQNRFLHREEATSRAHALISTNEEILLVDTDLTNEVLNSLKVDNSILLFHDPQYDAKNPPRWVKDTMADFESVPEQQDQYYHFKYKTGSYKEPAISKWSESIGAKNFQVLRELHVLPPVIGPSNSTENSRRPNTTDIMAWPSKVYSAPGVEVWQKTSALAISLPKVWMWATVRPEKSITTGVSPEELQFNGETVVDCVTFELRSILADYIIAGYDFSISWEFSGYFQVRVFGWRDQISEFMHRVVEGLSNPQMTHFDLVLKEKTESLSRSRPLADVAGEAMSSLTVGSATVEDIRGYLNTFTVTRESLKTWVKDHFKAVYSTVYTGGSKEVLSESDAIKMGKNLQSAFGLTGVIANSSDAVYFVGGPKFVKPVEVRMMNPTANDPNCALLYSLTYGSDMNAKDRILAALLASIVDPLVFRTIRTEHQMGYIASGRTGVYPGPAGSVQFRVYIQGNQASPDMMEARLEELLSSIPDVLAKIPVSEVSARAQGVAASLGDVPNSAHVEISQFWGSISDESDCFNRGANQAKYLESTDPATLKQGIIELFEAFTVNRRSKVVVKVWGNEGVSTVPVWNQTEISLALQKDDIVQRMQQERNQTVILTSVSKRDRDTAFETAVNSADPMWDPVVPTCDVA